MGHKIIPQGLILPIKVTPQAKQEGLFGWENGALKIRVHAPPDKGAANKGVIELLAKILAIPQRSIILLKGRTSRQKVLLIALPPDELSLLSEKLSNYQK